MNRTTSPRSAKLLRSSAEAPDLIADELRRYDDHLRDVCGLAAGTRFARCRIVARLLRNKFAGGAINMAKHLVDLNQMSIGVACSQLMAGACRDNADEDIARCGYANRDEVEMKGPVRLAEDLIELIKIRARKKRERLGGQVNGVDITVALVGDSRTGKSETAEKMEGILDLQMV